LLSDVALDAFGISIIRPGEEVWRFIDDPPSKLRRSAG